MNNHLPVSQILDKKTIIAPLRYLLEEAQTNEGRKDMFLQALFNKFLNLKIYQRSEAGQNAFMAEVTETLVLHNRELRKKIRNLGPSPTRHVDKLQIEQEITK